MMVPSFVRGVMLGLGWCCLFTSPTLGWGTKDVAPHPEKKNYQGTAIGEKPGVFLFWVLEKKEFFLDLTRGTCAEKSMHKYPPQKKE